jgi:hypothetical protein
MATVNGSFVSPSADATIVPQLFAPSGLIGSVLEGFTVWKALLTLFLAAVIYDQRKSHRRINSRVAEGIPTEALIAIHGCSSLLLAEGLYCWTSNEAAFHGTVPPIRQPQVP